MTACVLLWYRTTARGSIRKLAGIFETAWEAQRWVETRPQRTKPGRDGSLWIEIEVRPGEWASVGRARSVLDIRRVLRKPDGLRVECREVIRVWD